MNQKTKIKKRPRKKTTRKPKLRLFKLLKVVRKEYGPVLEEVVKQALKAYLANELKKLEER